MNAPYMDEQALLNGLFAFLDQSVSPFHAAAAAGRLLEEAGYTLCPEGQPWHLEAGAAITPPATARRCWPGGCPGAGWPAGT